MNSFFVYGGCISRDVFNPEYNKGGIKLAHYAARTSIAKFTSPPCKITIDDEKITSSFQRKILKNDFHNNIFKYIDVVDYDYLLIDLMFLRYSIVKYGNAWLTYSSELKKTGLISSKNQRLCVKDDAFWDKFKEGLDHLFLRLQSLNKLRGVVVNELYLATADFLGEKFSNQEYIYSQNRYLEKAYDIMKGYIDKSNFISYDPKLFVANPDHRWGRDPMHYKDEFYIESYNKLRGLDENSGG